MATDNPVTCGALSRTSIMVAAGRAFGALEPDPAVRNPDFLAGHLLGDDVLDLIAEHPLAAALRRDAQGNYELFRHVHDIAIMLSLMIVRTRYIDAALAHAVAAGARQVVLLGAGLDTRAYRLREILSTHGAAAAPPPTVFEVDAPATQAYKRALAELKLGPMPAHLRYVAVDFNEGRLGEALASQGYDPGARTFFALEGVSMYLSEQSLVTTLEAVQRTALPGSRLALDFVTAALLDVMQSFDDMPASKYTSKWSEPWRFGVPDGGERVWLEKLGFEVDDLLGLMNPATQQRYLRRADGTLVVPDREKSVAVSEALRAEVYGPRKYVFRMLPLFVAVVFRRSLGQGIALLSVPESRSMALAR